MGDMKEIRDTALAYYHNLSKEQQQAVYTFFKQMDADGDGTITIKEFENVLEDVISGDDITRLFRDMDKDGDGRLDFEEAITFSYVILNNRIIGCDGCKLSFIKGLYFTCVDCFDCDKPFSYDLCISCYGSRKYVHQHSNFLDNYAFLRCKSTAANQPTTPSTSVRGGGNESDYAVLRSTSKTVVPRSTSKTVKAVRAIGTGIEIGDAISTGIEIGDAISTGIEIGDAISTGADTVSTIADVAIAIASCTIM